MADTYGFAPGSPPPPPAASGSSAAKPINVDPFKLLNQVLSDLGRVTKDVVTSPLQIAVPALKAFGDGLAEAGEIANRIGGPITSLISGLGSIGGALAQAGGSALRATAEALLSLKDVAAVVLSPLRGMRDLVSSTFDDLLKSARKSLKPLLGEVVDVFGGLGKQAGGLMGGIGELIPQGLKSAFGKASSYLASVGSSAGSALTAVGGALGKMVGAAGAAAQGALAAGQAMAQFVGMANPALLQVFTNAVDDMMAVIGQGLAPIFVLVTQVIRMAADTMAGFMGVIGSAIAAVLKPAVAILAVLFEVVGRVGQAIGRIATALAPALAAIGNAFVAMYQAVQPVLDLVVDLLGAALVGAVQILAGAIEMVMPFVMAFAHVLSDLVKFISGGVRELLALIGVDLPDKSGTTPGASVGAAAKGTSIGSIDSVISKAQQSAFSLGSAANDPAARTAGAAEGLKAKADEIYALIQQLPETLVNFMATLPQRMWDLLLQFPELLGNVLKALLPGKETVDKVKGAVGDAANWAERQADGADDWSKRQLGVSSWNPLS